MVIIPTIIAAIIIHWKDAPNWMFWSVIGFGIFAQLCGKTVLSASDDLEQGRETHEKVFIFWTILAMLVTLIQWAICIAAIAFSIIFFSKSPQEAKRFEDSIRYSMKANEISASLPNLQMTINASKMEEKQNQMISLLQKSQKLAGKIDDEFLQKLHSQLPLFYRNKLIAGQELYVRGIKDNNPAKQMAAAKLLTEWQDYWEINGQSIISKMENR